mmetsp:Transcript_23120/g.33870  ORF Transcript_23120/g.33870 Transcript_23120/m.33870 type:complete len:669 (-) Transcript_23120:158-2164(-)|eukprot:CAMPEP_0185040628 /NCGR_PEP_ID=MMETSP1103-20130426/38894_1 /TAXON_ID=36769 /ORGANISM="Paraphysomonas bandaiensis, Strain Caron Lab Isolate" /LENGTH=668 /DNA_ID=CAMNT_0027580007 /DNA_START=73 /DNA_END=2079 /DNA_ORIENTATION=-
MASEFELYCDELLAKSDHMDQTTEETACPATGPSNDVQAEVEEEVRVCDNVKSDFDGKIIETNGTTNKEQISARKKHKERYIRDIETHKRRMEASKVKNKPPAPYQRNKRLNKSPSGDVQRQESVCDGEDGELMRLERAAYELNRVLESNINKLMEYEDACQCDEDSQHNRDTGSELVSYSMDPLCGKPRITRLDMETGKEILGDLENEIQSTISSALQVCSQSLRKARVTNVNKSRVSAESQDYSRRRGADSLHGHHHSTLINPPEYHSSQGAVRNTSEQLLQHSCQWPHSTSATSCRACCMGADKGDQEEHSQYMYTLEVQEEVEDGTDGSEALSQPQSLWHTNKKDAEIVKHHVMSSPLPSVPPGLDERQLAKVAKERAVRLGTYDPSTGLFGFDSVQHREEVNEFYKQKQILKKKQEDENLREIRYRNEIAKKNAEREKQRMREDLLLRMENREEKRVITKGKGTRGRRPGGRGGTRIQKGKAANSRPWEEFVRGMTQARGGRSRPVVGGSAAHRDIEKHVDFVNRNWEESHRMMSDGREAQSGHNNVEPVESPALPETLPVVENQNSGKLENEAHVLSETAAALAKATAALNSLKDDKLHGAAILESTGATLEERKYSPCPPPSKPSAPPPSYSQSFRSYGKNHDHSDAASAACSEKDAAGTS